MTETHPDILIAVMGLTGSGKSTFINTATQSEKKLEVGHSIRSCTDTVDTAEPFDLDGRRVVLFDTPGFDDTNKSEIEILNILASELEKQYREDMKLHGIIYVHRISDIRIGSLAKSNFGIFRKLCGEKSLKNVVIVTNMWSKVDVDEGARRVAELTSLDDFFKPALQKQAVMMHHNPNTVESAHEIIRHILKNHPEPLAIQEEIVDHKKNIDQTSAGIEVDKRIAELVAQFEKKLKEQIEAAEEARKKRDEEVRQEQLESAEKIRKAIARLEEDKANQANAYRMLQAQFADSEERMRKVIAAEERRREFRYHGIKPNGLRHTFLDLMQLNQPHHHPSATYKAITSGYEEGFTLYNKMYQLYATLDDGQGYVMLKDYIGSSRQKWIFTKVGSDWTIKSASSNRYMSLNRNGNLHARNAPTQWRIVSIGKAGFRLYVSGTKWDGLVISVDSGRQGEKLNVYESAREHDETWEIVSAD